MGKEKDTAKKVEPKVKEQDVAGKSEELSEKTLEDVSGGIKKLPGLIKAPNLTLKRG